MKSLEPLCKGKVPPATELKFDKIWASPTLEMYFFDTGNIRHVKCLDNRYSYSVEIFKIKVVKE